MARRIAASVAKQKRHRKKQMGQFLTPRPLARALVAKMELRREDKVLEPSMGDGAFVLPLIGRFMDLYPGSRAERLRRVLQNNIYGVELDADLFARCLANIQSEWGAPPDNHHLERGDFLLADFRAAGGASVRFDRVVGNPPFGGTINPAYQDALDKRLGFRGGLKIKKETYAFFIVKSVDLLRQNGRLTFICSDTFLTIKTMKGLRDFLSASGKVEVTGMPFFSPEVSQRTVLLQCAKGEGAGGVAVDGQLVAADDIRATPNHSWRVSGETAKFFRGPKIGDFMTASSGMTVGKNEYFVRDINGGEIIEPYDFSFYQKPITLADAVARARLGRVSPSARREIAAREARGETMRDVRVSKKKTPKKIKIPHRDYRPYNKARRGIVYAPPAHLIFWRDDGDAVYTYKNNGNWYLRGVGGQKYFFREGLTWNLVASKLHLRYLPPGCVLDSGAPCAFLNAGAARDEMLFILGWGLTDLCNALLKNIINHTKNIQGKDFERLPYPFWVAEDQKAAVVAQVGEMIDAAKRGKIFDFTSPEIHRLNDAFAGDGDWDAAGAPPATENAINEMSLINAAARAAPDARRA